MDTSMTVTTPAVANSYSSASDTASGGKTSASLFPAQTDAQENMLNLTLPTQYGSNQDPQINAADQLSDLANNIANAIGDQSSSNTGTSTGAYSGGAVAQGEPGPTSGSTGGKGTVGTTSTNLADYIGR